MADHVNVAKRSEMMRLVKGKNTFPELLVRRFLFEKGFRFRLHDKKLPGTPDIVLKRFSAIIFVQGCFWHGHLGCKKAGLPKTRTDWWRRKIDRNMEKDLINKELLEEAGWRVFYVWQCDLAKCRDKVLQSLAKELRAQ